MEKLPRRSRASRADKGVNLSQKASRRRYSPFIACVYLSMSIFFACIAIDTILGEYRNGRGFQVIMILPIALSAFLLWMRALVVSQGQSKGIAATNSDLFNYLKSIFVRKPQAVPVSAPEVATKPLETLQTTSVQKDAPVVRVGRSD